jgi:hypothetical protein
MHDCKTFIRDRGLLFYQNRFDPQFKPKYRSPRSYYAGHGDGFMCGMAVGFVWGIIAMCLISSQCL